jgi:hypothetical protein
LERWDALDGPIPDSELIASLEALRIGHDDLADLFRKGKRTRKTS